MLDAFWQDVRYAARMLRKNPGFTAIAVLMLALGIGANSTVFSVAKAILFRPLGIEDSDRVVWLKFTNRATGQSSETFSWVDFTDLRTNATSFEQMALIAWPGITWQEGDRREPLTSLVPTEEIFQLLRVRPLLGRALEEADFEQSAPPVIMIGYEFWLRRFAGDPAIIGRTLRLDDKARTIVGVLPPGLEFPVGHAPSISTGNTVYAGVHDVWLPAQFRGEDGSQRSHRMTPLLARLKPGVEFSTAKAELATIGQRWAADFPELNRNLTLEPILYRDKALGPTQKGIHVLAVAVAAVLIICCVNLANLLLARGVARRRELAVRHALGAGRARTVRTLLAESALLSFFGGGIGLLLAIYAIRLIRTYGPADMPFINEIAVDGTVIAVTAAICFATAIVFGFLPALWQSRIDGGEALKSGIRSSAGPEIRSWQRALLVGQIALAVVLVISASLLLESFRRLMSVDMGYQAKQVITLDLGFMDVPTNEDNVRLYREAKRQIAALPGVEAVGTIQSIPLTGKWTWEEKAQVQGRPLPPSEQPSLAITFVAFDYFQAMQIPLISGRVFREDELRDDGYGNVIIINEAAAKTLFPDESPLGKSFAISSSSGRYYEIVGVVRDTRDVKLEQKPQPRFYLHYAHGGSQLLVRTSGPAAPMVPMLRATLKKFGAQLNINSIKSMGEIVSDTVAERRFLMAMLTIYASVALAIAAVGIFGVAAYQVAQRTNEFGIRLALGATPRNVMRLVLGEAARWTTIGLGLGILLALAAGRFLANQLFGLSPHDPLLFATVTLFLLAVGLLASLLPARRAANVDPLTALRCE